MASETRAALAHGIGVVLAILAVALLPLLTDNGFYLRLAFMVGVNYLAAAGLNALVNHAGQKSLGHAGLFAVGAYTVALLTARLGWNPWAAFAMAGVVAGLFGVLIALPALRVRGPGLAMVTIGFGIVMEKIVSEWQDVFAGQQGIYGVASLSVPISGEMFSDRHWVWFVGALGIAAHVLLRALLAGRFGRAFRAVGSAELAAESVGVSVYRFKVLAFVISAVTVGLAGALVAQQNQYINSDFITFNLSVFFLLVVLLGGSSVYGPLLGAVLLTLLDAFLARWPSLQHFSYGALLLFALYAMPDGLSGALSRAWRRLRPLLPEAATGVRPWQATVQTGSGADALQKAQTLLDVDGLHKSFGGVLATQNVHMRLQGGHVYSLIGPNGAGKTTLLNIISGIITPERGSIHLMGRNIAGAAPWRICHLGLGRTFQNLRLFADMSVLDNVKMGVHRHMHAGFFACLLNLPAAIRAERNAREAALSILEFLELSALAHVPAGSLPYGQQRRVEIARALATDPRLLLLDEPAAGLNPQETQELIQIIARIRDHGITILLIEHHMELVMAISDHVFVLDYGEKIAEGAPAAVQTDPRVVAAYLGAPEEVQAVGESCVGDETAGDETSAIVKPASASVPAPAVVAVPQQVLLRVEDLRVRYGAIEALKGVSLDVHEGEIVTIIGGNGAGKTTLMRSISGLQAAAGGCVHFSGQDITQMPGHQRGTLGIAQSPEGRQVFADQSVYENLLLGAWHRRADVRGIAADIEAQFARFPRLRERQKQLAGTLSGGEQQMLAIARALMAHPKLLLLDEPSLGLAPLIVQDIFQTIRELRSQGVTILLVEQMANQALAVADRAYVLETGTITAQGRAQDLRHNPKVRAAYLGGGG